MNAPPSLADLDPVADLMLAVADAEILPRFRALAADDIRTKTSATDLVTVADEAAERVLTAELARRFPDALVVGEEAVAADPSLLRRLAGADFAIVIDPVDGTRNFAAGLAVFGVMVGFLVRGEPVASVICDPVVRDWSLAARGAGAWIRHRDGRRERLHTAAPKPVAQMEGCGLWTYLQPSERAAFAARLTRFTGTSGYRCVAQECRAVADGRFDFVVYHRLTPWDHVPCVILHREAGGHVAHLDGEPYDPLRAEGGILYAPDATSWDAIRDLISRD